MLLYDNLIAGAANEAEETNARVSKSLFMWCTCDSAYSVNRLVLRNAEKVMLIDKLVSLSSVGVGSLKYSTRTV